MIKNTSKIIDLSLKRLAIKVTVRESLSPVYISNKVDVKIKPRTVDFTQKTFY